jgi:glycerophosphoryl diester phosphodiesterase
MRKLFLFVAFLAIFSILKCDDNEDPNNINIESITYELTYNNYSVVKVLIKTYDSLESDVSFKAYLLSEEDDKEYELHCFSTYFDIIECYSKREENFNLHNHYYFYYNKTNSHITFDENDILEDDKRVSLIFEPEIDIEEKLYRDHHKITVETDGHMVSGGYLYIVRSKKKVLQKPKDGFNKFIELNNIIPHVGLHDHLPPSTLQGFSEAIKRGYHIINADLRFTSDNMPVICDDDMLEKISNGKGAVSSRTFEQLEKLNFGSKFDKNFQDEKVMTFAELLVLCKKNDVIIDLNLDHLDYDKYFGTNSEYIKIMFSLVEKFNMTDSIIFEANSKILSKLQAVKKNITVAVILQDKAELDKVKDSFKDCKRVIYSFGINVDEATVKQAISLGKKVKVSLVDSPAQLEKLQGWGVNYMLSRNLPPFIIQNEKEEAIMVRCYTVDEETSECDIDDYLFLKDNEDYSIYYSENIYNTEEDIDPEPLAEFKYINTNLLDELYYYVHYLNFERESITLILSESLPKNEKIKGLIGPENDDLEDCYLFNFECQGNGTFSVNCHFDINEPGKIYLKWAHYSIHSLDDYSLNELEVEERKVEEENEEYQEKEGYINYVVEKEPTTLYTFLFVFAVIVIVIIICILRSTKCKKPVRTYVRITDNNYMSDDNLYRY